MKPTEVSFDVVQLSCSSVDWERQQLRTLFLEILENNGITQEQFFAKLEEQVVRDHGDDPFTALQIFDNFKDTFNSSNLTWEAFRYAMKLLGAKEIKIVVE